MKRTSQIDKVAFREAVYDVVKTIPYGRVTSYGAIAKAIGYSNMSRMVGAMMGSSDSVRAGIAAHRVVNSQGVLSGKAAFGMEQEMQKLLESEGVAIVNDRIQNWRRVFWNPIEEIQF